MPWKELSKMDERMRFVARLMEGEKMAVLCREFDISRKTGYKIFNRYKQAGIEGLTDRSRRPYRHANRLPFQIEQLILQLKEKRSSWGAQKIRDKINLLHTKIHLPAISTVHAKDANKTLISDDAISVDVEIEPARLIKSLYVSPTAPNWFGELVEALVRRYSLSCDVIRSNLYNRLPTSRTVAALVGRPVGGRPHRLLFRR